MLCGVLVPAIVSSLTTFEPGSPERAILMQTSIVLSVLGTLSVALEDFFQFGARATAMKTCVMIIDKEFWYELLLDAASVHGHMAVEHLGRNARGRTCVDTVIWKWPCNNRTHSTQPTA